ncbi:MAG TPA: LptF/LptG family permease [Candidatus Hydrogenedentes bacterium]|nr:LptF/LptG family permease [Candidatus Hydrogenedentota bacterium]
MTSILSRYILRNVAVPAVISAVIVGFFIVGSTVRAQLKNVLDLFPPEQIQLLDVGRVALFALPALAGYVVPITFLFGVMMAFARMARNSELIAMKAAGIPLKRAILPVLICGALLSVVEWVIIDMAAPLAYSRMARMVALEMPLRLTLDMLPTGVMQEYGEWRVYIGQRDPDGTLRRITVVQQDKDGGASVFHAASARLIRDSEGSVLEMRQGHLIPADPSRHVTFEVLRQRVPAPRTGEIPDVVNSMSLRQLLTEERKLGGLFRETGSLPVAARWRNVQIELKDRLAFPLMCLAVCVAGAPIGARTSRTGRSYAYAAGLFIVAVYFILRKVSEPPLLLPTLPTILIGQIPNLLLIAWGAWLISRVDRV